MDKEKARLLLDSYQPSLGPQGDPEMKQALALLEQDPELKAWFEEQQEFDAQISRALEEIPAPPNLRGDILAGMPARRRAGFLTHLSTHSLAIAAAIILFLGLGALVFRSVFVPANENQIAAAGDSLSPWQEEVFRSLESGFKLQWTADSQSGEGSTLAEMKQFLTSRQAPVPAEILTDLRDEQIIGCLKFSTAFPMSQICFTAGEGQVVHIITVPHGGDIEKAADRPLFGGRGDWSFASWSDQNASYMLVTAGAADLLREYL